jgi:excisionase family DNA binding protein
MSGDERNVQDLLRRMEPVAVAAEDHAATVEVYRALADAAFRSGATCELVVDGRRIAVAATLAAVFERAAEVLATGDAIAVVPVSAALTTQQAADLVGVSRQYLVRLIDGGRLPFTRTGSRRRIALHDVLALRAAREPARAVAGRNGHRSGEGV